MVRPGHANGDHSNREPLLPLSNAFLEGEAEDVERVSDNVVHDPDEEASIVPWKEELTTLIDVAWPVALSSFCRLIMAVTDISVLGRLDNGTEYLAAASLAFVVMDVTIVVPASASDSLNQLCAQADGANNKMLVGRWLQLGVIITSLMCIPVVLIWCFTSRILMLLGFSQTLASLANTFALWSIFGAIPNNFYYCIRQYFQAQKIVRPALYNNIFFVFVNFGLNVVLVHGFSIGQIQFEGLGFIGSPIATSVSRTLQPIAFVLYTCVWKRLHAPTWPTDGILHAFTRARVKEFFAQSLPTIIGSAAEQWQMEIITLMAASLGIVDVATQTAVFNVFFTLHCFAFGVAKSTTCRVGYHLGFGSPGSAKRASTLAFLVTGVIGSVIGGILIGGRNLIGHIYSNDPAVWADSASIGVVLGFGYIGVSLLVVFSATLFGQGRPTVVAVIGIVSTWLLSLPLAYILAFPLKLGLRGLWIGSVIAYFVYTLAAGFLVWRSDWKKLSVEAMTRSERVPSVVIVQQQPGEISSPAWGVNSPRCARQ